MTDTLHARISDNLSAVRARMARAAERAHRSPDSIRLIAVSKTFDADHVRAAAAAGQCDFGENRIQEALPKIEATRELGLRWHLVGHLQSNKARKALGPFALVHSIDSLELIERLERLGTDTAAGAEGLIEVDLAGETSKHGLPIGEADAIFERAATCTAVRVVGLMVMPPFLDDPEQTRPYFQRLRELGESLASRGVPRAMLRELSMGMSHDFEVAIEEGATMIRVGTAIFGPRTTPPVARSL